MKINFTSERPIFKNGKRKYIDLLDEFVKGDDNYLVFNLEPEDKIVSLRNSLHVGIRRRGYKGIIVHSNKKDNVVYLEKVASK